MFEKLKTVLPTVILKKKPDPQLHQFLKTHKTIVLQRILLHILYTLLRINQATLMLSDRVINLHFLVGVGGGTFVVGPFFKNTTLHSDLLVKMLSDASKNLHYSEGRGWGNMYIFF